MHTTVLWGFTQEQSREAHAACPQQWPTGTLNCKASRHAVGTPKLMQAALDNDIAVQRNGCCINRWHTQTEFATLCSTVSCW